jgi:hypothetical protein
VKLPVYQHLFDVNAGFDQVIRSLDALAQHDAFHRREIERFRALSKEARAATTLTLPGSWSAPRRTKLAGVSLGATSKNNARSKPRIDSPTALLSDHRRRLQRRRLSRGWS